MSYNDSFGSNRGRGRGGRGRVAREALAQREVTQPSDEEHIQVGSYNMKRPYASRRPSDPPMSSIRRHEVSHYDDQPRQERPRTNNARINETLPDRGPPLSRQSSDSASRETRENREPRLGFKLFESWAAMDPEHLLHTLNSNNSFRQMLNNKDIKDEWTPIIVKMLATALESTLSRQMLVSFLTFLHQSQFIRAHLAQFVVKLMTGGKRRDAADCIKNLLAMFRIILITVPSKCDTIMPTIATIEYAFQNPNTAMLKCVESECLLDEVKMLMEDVQNKQKQERTTKDKQGVLEPNQPPPDDFRTISIFPKSEDIYRAEDEVYLRKNKLKGGYDDVNHYLDVQFRLMREDFVAPLRDGIRQYLEQLHTRNRGRLNDIRVYSDVHILYPVCAGNKGITYRVRFDVSKLARIRWQVSKRLIYGSLVCLSQDQFEHMLFATVSNRDLKQISKGEIELQFEDNHEQVSAITADQSFTMAETTAYFEAYRHVLTGLQEMRHDIFQFQRYIVHAANDVNPPQYLERNRKEDGVFDLRPLVDVTAKAAVPARRRLQLAEERDLDLEIDGDSADEDDEAPAATAAYSAQAERIAKAVKLLQAPSWPTASALHLDPSQYRALKAALTREFAIIQGPPGTGKTYIGLKVVKALLHNYKAWCRDPVTTVLHDRPILLVCYTNHALDQFLEGVAKYVGQQGIVRVGGRSQSDAMAPFLLKNLRNDLRRLREVPVAIHRGRVQAREDMEEIEMRIEEIGVQMEAAERGVMHEDILGDVISPRLRDSLIVGFQEHLLAMEAIGWQTVGASHTSAISEWLALSSMQQEEEEKAQRRMMMQQQMAAGLLPVDMETNMEVMGLEEDDDLVDIEDELQREADSRILDNEDDSRDANKGKKSKNRDKPDVNRYLALNVDTLDADDVPTEASASAEMAEQVYTLVKVPRRKLKRRLRQLLQSTDMMTSEEEMQVQHVWQLDVNQRWRLYRYWMYVYRRNMKQKVRQLEQQYQEVANVVSEILLAEDLEILRKAKVIGMTTTAAAKYRRVLAQTRPKVIVVEEAAEVLESHVVTTLTDSCEHLVLIGDHKQLRPSPNVYKLAKKYHLEVSLFERMVNNGVPCETLQEQHRMRPHISSLMLNIYPDLRDHEAVLKYDDIKGVQSNLFFITHNFPEQNDDEMRSKSNEHEAQYIAALCGYLLLQGYKPEQITVLTPYTGQLMRLRRLMPKSKFNGVRVTAVDNFQGEENDIILLSLVRSNNDGKVGFLGEDNRVCVALSRAKMGFYIIGNLEFLSKHSDMWNKMKVSLEKADSVGPVLHLQCQNHSDISIPAKMPSDFNNAPEGGCHLPCETRLPCGHVCTLACHPYDKEHKQFKCRKPCGKTLCDKGHRCQKLCYVDCGKCVAPQDKIIPKCGHTQKVPCWQQPRDFVCQAPCAYVLDCGHKCSNVCGKDHTTKCMVSVPHTFTSCGHSGNVLCHDKTAGTIRCKEKCKAELSCGDGCRGNCSSCFEGLIHDSCSALCKRVLVCGHTCMEPCASNCPPCKRMCENQCRHSKCPQLCGVPCNPCREPCEWRCPHYECTKLCFEPCNRPRCNRPCNQRLPCGHFCIGMCGEPCPDKCRFCDHEIVQEMIFGTEDEPDARFVQLEDCCHVIEVTGLDRWMDQENNEIGMKVCPKCKTPIRRNLRYGAVVKRQLADVEEVKAKLAGDAKAIGDNRRAVEGNIELLRLELAENGLTSTRSRTELIDNLVDNVKKAKVIQEVARYDHTVSFLRRLSHLWKELKSSKCPRDARDNIQVKVKALFEWLADRTPRMTSQQVREIDSEVKRLSMVHRLTTMKDRLLQLQPREKLDSGLRVDIAQAELYLYAKKPLTEAQAGEVEHTLDKLKKALPVGGLGVSEEERKMIDSVMSKEWDGAKGHWFKCPKGHIYAIGDCGGAMQEAKCPECGAVIGGTNHSLRRDNALASEMDGAHHAAWSEQANMANYRFI